MHIVTCHSTLGFNDNSSKNLIPIEPSCYFITSSFSTRSSTPFSYLVKETAINAANSWHMGLAFYYNRFLLDTFEGSEKEYFFSVF